MGAFKPGTLSILLVLLPACGQQLVEFAEPDGAGRDTVRVDTAIQAAAVLDAGSADVPIATPDTAIAEGAVADAEGSDIGDDEAAGL